MGHTFNSSTLKIDSGRSLEFEASLIYIVSSRPARATERDSVFKKKKKSFLASPSDTCLNPTTLQAKARLPQV